MGRFAFRDSGVEEVTFASGATTVWESAFEGAASLRVVNLPPTLSKIEGSAFRASGVEHLFFGGQGAIDIGSYAFRYSGLRSVTFDEGITEILGSHGFRGTPQLETLNLPSTLTRIGSYMFKDTGLRTLVIPPGVTNFGFDMLGDNDHLECLTVPPMYQPSDGKVCDNCPSLRAVSGFQYDWGVAFPDSPCVNGCPSTDGAQCPEPPPVPAPPTASPPTSAPLTPSPPTPSPPTPIPPTPAPLDGAGRIVCPVIGMFVKNGLLVPDVDGFITKEQTKAVFLARGIPEDIATATTDGNFRSANCSACPQRINPFVMNPIRTGDVVPSPDDNAQEHFRSTGIRDTDDGVPRGDLLSKAETWCLGDAEEWTQAAVLCLADLYDRDPGCSGSTSNDVSSEKRPDGCGMCESFSANPSCRSALQDSIENLFLAFRDPVTMGIARADFRGMWLDLDFPGATPAPPTPAPPTASPPTPAPPTASPPTPAPPTSVPPTPVPPPPVLTLADDAGTTHTLSAGVIEDGWAPEYPDNLEASETWIEIVGSNCLLTWREMHIEENSSCSYDWVDVSVAGMRVAQHCRDVAALPPPLHLSGGGFRVSFKSDSSVSRSGFVLDFVCDALDGAAL
eukprot:TRINITY_DN2314_c0_g2_i4.p1 TRINITY_DN2314_c0_g2~~TRINITY_DN2314_c0_g2_i4.p1  ORF type:complete len:620 (+),score=118.90 TRINITY_DN2314_c0_g2_i4:953-2812(+)